MIHHHALTECCHIQMTQVTVPMLNLACFDHMPDWPKAQIGSEAGENVKKTWKLWFLKN